MIRALYAPGTFEHVVLFFMHFAVNSFTLSAS
jgi:hypothetical protein